MTEDAKSFSFAEPEMEDADEVGEVGLAADMADWEATCRQLRLPRESEQFTDFVLVFDTQTEPDDVIASPCAACCGFCRPSPKELQQALDVRRPASGLIHVSQCDGVAIKQSLL